jgi:hypothetical protein
LTKLKKEMYFCLSEILNDEIMRYYFKPDTFVVVVTLLCVALVTYVWTVAGPITTFSFWLAVVFTLIFLWYIVKIPMYTYVDEDVIRVQQLVGDLTFRRSEVSVRRLTPRELDAMVRTSGSGGMGGYIGFFQNQYLGRFYMLALSRKDLALVTTQEGKFFVIHFPPQG